MNDQEAQEQVRAIEHLWKVDFGEDGRRIWRESLVKLDATKTAIAVQRLHETVRYRPTVSDVREVVRKLERDDLSARPKVEQQATSSRGVPLWVKRWIASRYLFHRFGKEQDMRPFPEQEGYIDPTVAKMPADAWVEEAAHVTDKDVIEGMLGAARAEDEHRRKEKSNDEASG